MKKVLILCNPLQNIENTISYGLSMAKLLELKAEFLYIVDPRDNGKSISIGDSQSFQGTMDIEQLLNKGEKETWTKIQRIMVQQISRIKAPPPAVAMIETGYIENCISVAAKNNDVELLMLTNSDFTNIKDAASNYDILKTVDPTIMLIPSGREFELLSHLKFITNFKGNFIPSLKKISELAIKLDTTIQLLYFETHVSSDHDYREKTEFLRKQPDFEKLPMHKITHEEISNKINLLDSDNESAIMLHITEKNELRNIITDEYYKFKLKKFPVFIFQELS